MTIREAAPTDIPSIQEIYARHVLEGSATFEEIPPSVTEMAERLQTVKTAGLPWLVAACGEQIYGYCYAAHYHKRSAFRYTLENSIYIRHEQRGRRIGTELLKQLIARCEAGPWRKMIAVIGDSSNIGSISLHRKQGFTFGGALHSAGFKHGRWVDIILMERALGEGDTTAPADR